MIERKVSRMDVFQRVRDLGTKTAPTDEAITRARGELAEAIRGERGRKRHPLLRRPILVIAGAVTGVAAATVGAIVISQSLPQERPAVAIPTSTPSPPLPRETPTPKPVPSAPPATASAVFAQVAERVKTSTPVPAPGQYLQIIADDAQLVSYNSVDGVNDLAVTRANAESAWVIHSSLTTFVPADLGAEWVRETAPEWVMGDTFGTDARARGEQWLSGYDVESDTLRFAGGPPVAVGAYFGPLGDFLNSAPTEPQALLDLLQDEIDDGYTNPQKVGWKLVELLSYNVGTAEQRSAMYDALSLLPGTEVLANDGATATLQFHTTSDGDVDPLQERWHTVTIDVGTGVVLETTDRIGSNVGLVPDAVADYQTRYTVTVVDEIP